MSTYSLINNGDTGLSVRATLNSLLTDINNGVGLGSSGTSGVAGSSGTSGANGSSGTSGTDGINGSSGTSGIGINGSSGTSGADGTSGSSGTSGEAGISGSSGTSGADGTSGSSGTSGQAGLSGSSGTSGIGLESGNQPSSIRSNASLTALPATASGTASISIGNGSITTDDRGIAIGENARAILAGSLATRGSIAIGRNSTSGGGNNPGLAIGVESVTQQGVAIGFRSTSGDARSVAVGQESAAGSRSVVYGWKAITTGGPAVSIGYTTNANVDGGIAIGGYATTNAASSLVISHAGDFLGNGTNGGTINAAATQSIIIQSPRTTIDGQYNIVIGGMNNRFGSGATNSVILNRSSFTASVSNTLFTNNIDATGYRINGTSGFSGTSGGFVVNSGLITSQSGPSKTPTTLVNDATIAWNYANAYNAEIGLTGNSAISITGATAGDYGTLKITHTNGSTILTFGANDKFAGGTHSFTSATNSVDIFSFYYDGTNFNWNYNLDYK
jgi:hypothetical protein